jgi:hypothetical protein
MPALPGTTTYGATAWPLTNVPAVATSTTRSGPARPWSTADVMWVPTHVPTARLVRRGGLPLTGAGYGTAVTEVAARGWCGVRLS